MSPLVQKLEHFVMRSPTDQATLGLTQDGPDQRAGTVSSDASDMTGVGNAGSHEVTPGEGDGSYFSEAGERGG